MKGKAFAYMESPIGLMEIGAVAAAVTSVVFTDGHRDESQPDATLREAVRQLSEYFLGMRTEFDLSIVLEGTPFQRLVWQQLRAMPFGTTASYRDVARAIGRPRAVRAVGAANGSNPISIIVPCHRVVGSNGSLTGYGGGLWRKEWLLRHEASRLL